MNIRIVTFEGKTKTVTPEAYHNMRENEPEDTVLLVDRSEDWYALLSPRLKEKKVIVISAKKWYR